MTSRESCISHTTNTEGGAAVGGNVTVHGGDFIGRDQHIYQADEIHGVRGLANPYLGLSAYTYEERYRYGGRTETIARAVELLTLAGEQRTLLFVTGASGSGKSSFVQAGLLQALEEYYRKRGISTRWTVMRPSRQPLAGLVEALRQLGLPVQGPFVAVQDYLNDEAVPLMATEQISLLVIDQFEEFFIQSAPDQRATFFELLSTLPPFSQLRMHIIATLRVDYLPDLFDYPALYERTKGSVDLRAMTPDELADAIQQPIRALYYDEKCMEAELVETLANEATKDAAYLPLLQVTCEDIWRRGWLKRAAYDTLTDAIRRRAEEVFTHTTDDRGNAVARPQSEQAEILHLLLDLVDVSPNDDIRRDVRRRRSLLALTRGEQQRRRLVEELTNQRLLSISRESSPETGAAVETVDIIHESLIVNWDRLQQAIEAQREQLQQRARFETAIQEWRGQDKTDAYLLDGVRLAEAEELAERKDVALQNIEAKYFLNESITHREIRRRRQRNTLVGAVGVLSLLLIIALGSTWWALEVNAVLDERNQQLDSANVTVEERNEQLDFANETLNQKNTQLEEANIQLEQKTTDLILALETAESQRRLAQSRNLSASSQSALDTNRMRAWLLAIEAGRLAGTQEVFTTINEQVQTLGKPTTFFHEGSVNGAVWNGDESRILSWSQDGTMRIWDTADGELLHTFIHSGYVVGAQWNQGENRILSWGEDGTVRVWDANTGELLSTLSHDSAVIGAQWNQDESLILSWNGNTVHIWDAVDSKLLHTLIHEGGVAGAQWNQDESRILSWNRNAVYIRNGADGELLRTFTYEDSVVGIQWSQDGSRILSWGRNVVYIRSADDGELLHTFAHENSVVGAQWNQDESYILSWDLYGTISVWNAAGKLIHTLIHENGVAGAHWNQDGSRILSWDVDHKNSTSDVLIWDVASGELLHTLTDAYSIFGAQWNQDESRILSWSGVGTVRIWDVADGELLHTFIHGSSVTGAQWNKNERLILSWGEDETMRIWDVASGELLHTLIHEGRVAGAQWNQDESRILSWSEDRTVRIWDVASGELLHTLISDGSVAGAQWNQDESRILSWGGFRTISVWDTRTGELLRTLTHDGSVDGAQWNQDGSRILSWGEEGTVRIWDTISGELLHTLTHDDSVFGVIGDRTVFGAQWNQDESRILSWGKDGTVRIWNASTGELLHTLIHEGYAEGAQWNHDDSSTLSWSGNTIYIWDVADGTLIHILTHDGSVDGAQWNQDGSRILSWDNVGTVQIWDADADVSLYTSTYEGSINSAQWNGNESSVLFWSGNTTHIWSPFDEELFLTFAGDGSSITNAQWSQSEAEIMFTTAEGKIYRYYTRIKDLLAAACTHATRNLTWQEWQQYLPDEPYQQTCPNLPIHLSVPESALTSTESSQP